MELRVKIIKKKKKLREEKKLNEYIYLIFSELSIGRKKELIFSGSKVSRNSFDNYWRSLNDEDLLGYINIIRRQYT